MGEDWGTGPRADASKVRLRDVLAPGKTTLDYVYDFGNCWEHRLTVANVRAGDPNPTYPRYVGGERNGPPRLAAAYPASTLAAASDPRLRTTSKQQYRIEFSHGLGRFDPLTAALTNDRYVRTAAIDHRHDLRRAVRTERLLKRKSESQTRRFCSRASATVRRHPFRTISVRENI